MAYCLPEFAAQALKEKFIKKELSPEKLAKMTSEERHAALSFLGEEHARSTNALFESKLLLKNQQRGMITWAKQVLGIKHPVYRDILAKVERMKEVMQPKETEAFLNDLISHRLGIKVTKEESAKLVELSKEIERTKKNLPKEFETMSQDEYLKQETPEQLQKRIEYGTAGELFDEYARSLNPKAKDITFKSFFKKPISSIGALAKSTKASIDNSFWLNQGIPALFNPRFWPIWGKNFVKSFNDLQKGLRGIDSSFAVRAEIRSRPDAVNGTYAREKIALGIRTEEAYPTSLPERIPVVGRLFKASSSAYNSAALRMRVDIADYYNKLARIQGVDLTDKINTEAIGHIVNSTSGRGSLGTSEAALNTWNNVMFSPRLVKGAFDTITAHLFDSKVKSSPFARKQAAKQLMSMVATYYAVTAIMEAMDPGSTEMDPRGAHFGQKKIGKDTYINYIGPFRPLIRTLAVLVPTFHKGEIGFWRKNNKGKWTGVPLYSKKSPQYGEYTPLDVAETFIEGKASPLLSAILNHWRGTDYTGEPVTPVDDARNLFMPISIDSYIEDSMSKNNEASDNALRNAIINSLGGGVVVYD